MGPKTNYIKIAAHIFIFLTGIHKTLAQDNKVQVKEYPVPQHNPKQLFYLQRNENTNTLIYELNEQNGSLDIKNPIHVYWLMYVKQGQQEELSGMEKKFVYGIKIKTCDNEQCIFTLAAYPKISLHLTKDSIQKYHVYVTPSKQTMILHRTFIKIKEGGLKLKPIAEYIEFSGTELVSGKKITERIIP